MNPIIDGILVMEGGYTNNPKDKGGATNWGITEATARAHGYTGEMINLTRAEAFSILEEDYWIKPGFEQISTISWPISFALRCRSQYWPPLSLRLATALAQRAKPGRKSYQDIKTDGKIGPRTLSALNHFLALRGKQGEEVLIKALNCSQGAYYLDITEKNKGNEEFIYGWMKARIT